MEVESVVMEVELVATVDLVIIKLEADMADTGN